MKKNFFLILVLMFFGVFLSSCSAKKTFEVTFVTYSGEDIVIEVKKGNTIPKDQYPVLNDTESKIFVGWEYSVYNEDTQEWEDKIWEESNTVEEDIFLIEEWRDRYSYTCYLHYGMGEYRDGSFIGKEGFLLQKPNVPVVEGYEFVAWFTDENYENQWNFAQDKIYEELDLYAKWNDPYGNLALRIHDKHLEWNKTDKALDVFVDGIKKASSISSGKILLSELDKDLVEEETHLIELKAQNQVYAYFFYNKKNEKTNFNLQEPTGLKINDSVLSWDWAGDANALKYFEVYLGGKLVATQTRPSLDLKEKLKDFDSNSKTKITVIAKTTRPYLYSSRPSTINFESLTKEYDVKFIYDGKEETLKTVNGKIANFTPNVAGKVFNGWYSSFDNGITLISEWNLSNIVNDDISLYADFVENILVSGKTVLSAPKISVKAGGIEWNRDNLNTNYFEYILYGLNKNGLYEELESSDIHTGLGEYDFIYDIKYQIEKGLSDKLKLEIRSSGNGVNTVNSAWVTRYVSMEIGDIEVELNEDVGLFYWQKFAENYQIEISQSGKVVLETQQKENEIRVPETMSAGNYTIKVIDIDDSSSGEYVLSTGNNLTLAQPSNININFVNKEIFVQIGDIDSEFSYDCNIYYGDNITYSIKGVKNATLSVPENITTMHLEIVAKDDNANYFKSNSTYFLLENLNSKENFKISGSDLVSNENMYEFTYEYNSDLEGIEIKSYIGKEYNIIAIPSHINEIPVIKLGQNIFETNKYFDVLLLPNTIKELPNSAFYGLNLTYLYLPEGLEKIGNNAFLNNYKLKDPVLPESLLYVGDSAFKGVHFDNLVLPSKIQHIGTNAFSNQGEMEFVIIPSSVEYLGERPFGYQTKILFMPSSLDTSSWDENWFDARYDSILNTYVRFYDTEKYQYFVYDENKVFLYDTKIKSNSNQIVNLKTDFNEEDLELVYIGRAVFSAIAIKEVILPDTLKYVGDYAFYQCYAKIVVPASVEYAGEGAFSGNTISPLGDTSNWK